jgi:NMD protein affecting ribosome stability and mRNA decay
MISVQVGKGKAMTEQEAIDWCEQFRDNIIMQGVKKEKYTLALKAMRTAITALEKQIPQKVEKMVCPSCSRIFLLLHGQRKGADFCDCCGQALDWGKDNG